MDGLPNQGQAKKRHTRQKKKSTTITTVGVRGWPLQTGVSENAVHTHAKTENTHTQKKNDTNK